MTPIANKAFPTVSQKVVKGRQTSERSITHSGNVSYCIIYIILTCKSTGKVKLRFDRGLI